jgi:hypothetical protein
MHVIVCIIHILLQTHKSMQGNHRHNPIPHSSSYEPSAESCKGPNQDNQHATAAHAVYIYMRYTYDRTQYSHRMFIFLRSVKTVMIPFCLWSMTCYPQHRYYWPDHLIHACWCSTVKATKTLIRPSYHSTQLSIDGACNHTAHSGLDHGSRGVSAVHANISSVPMVWKCFS